MTVELRNEECFINLKSSHFLRKVKKQLYIELLFTKVFYPGKVMCNNYWSVVILLNSLLYGYTHRKVDIISVIGLNQYLVTQCSIDIVGRCQTDQFRCDGGRCLPMSVICNGQQDCQDREDERNCPPKRTCTSALHRKT